MSRVTHLRRAAQRMAFAALYRCGGRLYDPLAALLFGASWGEWRRAALDYVASGPVLDLGCGTGVLLDELRRSNVAAVGLDREPSMLGAARRRYPRPACVRGDATALPFRNAVFEACLVTFPAPFIRDVECLREVARVLRPGGTLAVVVSGEWTRERPRPRLAAALLRLFYGSGGGLPSSLPDVPGLAGDWVRHPTPDGTALLWVAQAQD